MDMCTVASDLRIFLFAEDSSPAPSSFPLTITGLPSSFLFAKKVKSLCTKEGVDRSVDKL